MRYFIGLKPDGDGAREAREASSLHFGSPSVFALQDRANARAASHMGMDFVAERLTAREFSRSGADASARGLVAQAGQALDSAQHGQNVENRR